MLVKIETELKFNPKRNYKVVTPCCNKSNSDGKFVNYRDLPVNYGYCHSCGQTTKPLTLYKNEKGDLFLWNATQNKYEPVVDLNHNNYSKRSIIDKSLTDKPIKFVPENIIWEYFHLMPENNLLKYLRKTYGDDKVNDAKEVYAIGSTLDGGTVYWNINLDLNVQKAKVSYYNEIGKRTDKFKVPYKNEQGYYSCLFGEHLLSYEFYNSKTVILVESEKSAIVGYILMPEYIWCSYGGANGLTDSKTQCLIGRNVLIVPDMSETAVNIISEKIPHLKSIGINAKIWDMTDGKTDEELTFDGIYNNDLEDVFRKIGTILKID